MNEIELISTPNHNCSNKLTYSCGINVYSILTDKSNSPYFCTKNTALFCSKIYSASLEVKYKKQIIFLILLLVLTMNIFAQKPEKGYITQIENMSVFLDYTSNDVMVGDCLQVMSEPQIMVHPVSKKEIVKEAVIIDTLEITETQTNYSVANYIYPSNAITKLKMGVRISSQDITAKNLSKNGKVNVVIADAIIKDEVGKGYFTNYVTDLLKLEMKRCEKICIIDRSMLTAQINETKLPDTAYINSNNSSLNERNADVKFMIQITIQRPKVTNNTTGLALTPTITTADTLSKISGDLQSKNNRLDTTGTMPSNIQTPYLEAEVSLTATVVDIQTGEILFMCSGIGNAHGESQLKLEEDAMGGLQINGGVNGLKKTIIGKAVGHANRKIRIALSDYFNGKSTKIIAKKELHGVEMSLRHMNVYIGNYKLTRREIREAFNETPQLYFNYKKGTDQKLIGNIILSVGGVATYLLGITLPMYIVEWGYDPSYLKIALGCAFVVGSGYIIHKKGMFKIYKSINTYNQGLKKTSFTPTYKFGLTPAGLAFRLSF